MAYTFTQEENDTLTRVGPGTLMGGLLREYWTPVLRSERLEPDGAPVRVRLYGKNYVAFRTTDGRVGFFDEACPHRGASLALGQNAGNGLRCIYHGWRFGADAKVIYVPTEPRECAAAFAAGVKVHHYPVREAGGIVWVFPQEGKTPPKFPDLEFTHLPPGHVDVRVGVFNCNWLQALESVLDSAHLGQLHKSSADDLRRRSGDGTTFSRTFKIFAQAPAPRFEIVETPYGFTEGAIRDLSDGTRHVNLRQFIAPFTSLLPGSPDRYSMICIAVPHDDEWTSQFFISYHPYLPLPQDELAAFWTYADKDPNNIRGDLGSVKNLWNQDRAAMKAGHVSGFPGRQTFQEDFIVQESMGPIVDRTQENLGSSDTVIIHTRRALIRGAHALRAGRPPWGLEQVDGVDFSKIRATNKVIGAGLDWRDIDPYQDWVQAFEARGAPAAAVNAG